MVTSQSNYRTIKLKITYQWCFSLIKFTVYIQQISSSSSSNWPSHPHLFVLILFPDPPVIKTSPCIKHPRIDDIFPVISYFVIVPNLNLIISALLSWVDCFFPVISYFVTVPNLNLIIIYADLTNNIGIYWFVNAI